MNVCDWLLAGMFVVIALTILIFGGVFFFTNTEPMESEEAHKITLFIILNNLL